MKRIVLLLALTMMIATGLTAYTEESKVVFPIAASDNHRYLTDAEGKPFLYFADTGWFLFDVLSEKHQAYYLETRAAQGFSALQVMACWTFAKPNFYGETPFAETGKLSEPNDRYWQRMVDFAHAAEDKGLLINYVPLWLGYSGEQWYTLLDINTVDECFAFGQYLGRLFSDCKNVIWTMGGDHNPDKLYSRIDAIARGIRSVLPDVLISAHTHENQLAEDQYRKADWLTLNNVYTYFPQWNRGRNVYDLGRKATDSSLNLPWILIESGYENASIESAHVYVMNKHLRRQVYWAAISGATGYAYGNANVWTFNGLWMKSLEDEGCRQVIQADHFIRSLEWWKLVPDSNLVTAYENTGADPVLAAKAEDDTFLLVYFPPADDTKACCSLSDGSNSFSQAWWIDPVSGERMNALEDEDGVFAIPGRNADMETDWLLLLTN